MVKAVPSSMRRHASDVAQSMPAVQVIRTATLSREKPHRKHQRASRGWRIRAPWCWAQQLRPPQALRVASVSLRCQRFNAVIRSVSLRGGE